MQIEHASTKKTEGRAKTVLFRVSVCLLSVALALALVSAVLIYLARQDDNAGRSFEREVSLNFIMAGVAAAWTGQEVEVLPEDVNGLLNLLLQEQAARGKRENLSCAASVWNRMKRGTPSVLRAGAVSGERPRRDRPNKNCF